MLYTDEQRQQVEEFFDREWEAFSNYFFEHGKKATTFALIHFARVYANESGISSAPDELLSEEYMYDEIWTNIVRRMSSSLKMLQAGASKAPSPPSLPAEPLGIPRDGTEESIFRAKEELRLLDPDARRAVSPLEGRRLGDPFLSSNQDFPLYHETFHTASGMGKKNQSGGPAVITFFYVLQGCQYYLVAWGMHGDNDGKYPTYTVEEQLDAIPNLKGQKLISEKCFLKNHPTDKALRRPPSPTGPSRSSGKQSKQKFGRPPPPLPTKPPKSPGPPKNPPKRKK